MHFTKTANNSWFFFYTFCVICLFSLHSSTALAQFGNLVTTFNIPGDKLEVDPVNQRMYISSSSTGNILIIDTVSMTEIATIYVGDSPTGMALSADGSTLYVASSAVDLINVIDTASKQLINEIQLSTQPNVTYKPYDVEISADGRLFVTPADQGPGILQVDTITSQVISVFSLGVSIYRRGLLEMSPNGNTLYFANVGLSPGTLAAFDVSTVTPVVTYQNYPGFLGSNGQDLALTKDGKYISYAVGSGNDLYDIFKMVTVADFPVAGSFNTGAYPREITYSPDGNTAYTVHTSGQIDVFSATDYTLTNTINTVGQATELETDASGNYLFAAFQDSVRVYSLISDSNTPPVLDIISPTDGSSQTSTLVDLTGRATDVEDGDIHTNISWSSSIDGDLGVGANLVVNLSEGQHVITASITDSGGATTTAQVTITISLYCDARGLSTSYEWIDSFMINNNLFPSGNDQGYGDYTNTGLYLSKGTHGISVTPGFRYGAYNEFWRVWMDFNQNGQFENDEMVFEGSGRTTINATFTVPETALLGDTRMRITMRWAVAPSACGSFTWGEVEDYSISVTN